MMTLPLIIGKKGMGIILIYIAVISVISVIVTVYDKIAAKKLPKHRIRERTLMLLSLLGGSVSMLVTMYAIRHKTAHTKFMLGIPMIILLQLAGIWALLHFGIVALNMA